MDEASSTYDKALQWLKEGVAPSEITTRLQAHGLDAHAIRLLLAAATNALRETERNTAGAAVAPSTLSLTPPPRTEAPRVIGEPSLHKPRSTVMTVLQVLGGLAAFFTLLCIGFVFFVVAVCGHH